MRIPLCLALLLVAPLTTSCPGTGVVDPNGGGSLTGAGSQKGFVETPETERSGALSLDGTHTTTRKRRHDGGFTTFFSSSGDGNGLLLNVDAELPPSSTLVVADALGKELFRLPAGSHQVRLTGLGAPSGTIQAAFAGKRLELVPTFASAASAGEEVRPVSLTQIAPLGKRQRQRLTVRDGGRLVNLVIWTE